jgi:3-keto-5-aminohexanoate cleavage enzyme
MPQPIFLLVAPNGARKKKDIVPSIPLELEEIAEEALRCADAGVALFHLHIRDKEGNHLLDAATYQRTIDAIKAKTFDRMIIQTTTEAVGIYTPEEQMALIRTLKPDAASYGLRELIPSQEYEETAGEFFHWAEGEGIFPHYILYSPLDVTYFAMLKERGILPDSPSFVLFVLGKKHAPVGSKDAYAQPADLLPFVDAFNQTSLMRDGSQWAVCAFGGNENSCMLKAAELGGHVRIGFENNHLLPDGAMAPHNAALIAAFKTSLAGKRPIGTPAELYGMLGYRELARKVS